MLLNLLTLRAELADLLKTKGIATSRLDRWLNLAQSDVASEMRCEHLNVSKSFTGVEDQRSYHFGFEFQQVHSLRDTSNNIDLVQLSEFEIEERDPDLSDTGTPYFYSINGMSWVQNQPSSASVITIVSSETTDTSKTVRVRGYDANGTEIQEQITLDSSDSTTAVAGTTSFTTLTKIAKSESTNGIITVTSNASAVNVVRIPADLLAKQFQPVNMYPLPSSDGDEYVIRGIRRPILMVYDEDYPDMPEAFHELVLTGAAIRGHRDRFRPSLATNLMREVWDPGIAKLKNKMQKKGGKRAPIIGETYPYHYAGWLGSDYGDY